MHSNMVCKLDTCNSLVMSSVSMEGLKSLINPAECTIVTVKPWDAHSRRCNLLLFQGNSLNNGLGDY